VAFSLIIWSSLRLDVTYCEAAEGRVRGEAPVYKWACTCIKKTLPLFRSLLDNVASLSELAFLVLFFNITDV